MKHLLTAIACCLAVAGSAQTPYNPDTDGDQYITTQDLMSMLAVFGGPFTPNYFDTEEMCIVSNMDNYDCFYGDEIPPITFLTYSDHIDEGWDYGNYHYFFVLFDEWTAPIIPNGAQYWVLTDGSNDLTTIHFTVNQLNQFGEWIVISDQEIHFHNNVDQPSASYGNALDGLYPRLEKYMWWNGEIIKMN